MSIESITEKILKEADAYSDDQRAQAEAAAKETLDDARRRADEVIAKEKEKAAADAEVLKSRRASVADLEARKMRLAAKQELIDECFGDALTRLQNLDDETYIAFIREQIREFEDRDCEILLNAKDRERIGSKLEKELKKTKIRLSADTTEIEGGCILRQGNISYNASLEKLLENVKNDLTSEIAGILFQ